ncbi:hypothetical protein [uncultured Psychrobacter sp.]|uniref:hypothetical protein n=1 Tax=uncultured Psychrobacter sp. TaxID=259303 RepID=UPI0026305F75|nr:hypothetical protein [uncultured Psychrobacter sp.]
MKKKVKHILIITSTLFLSLGCEKSVNTSNEEVASFSTNAQSKKPSNYSQVSDTKTLECLLDNSESINIYYNDNFEELRINSYSIFTLTSINDIQTDESRLLEFTRIYKNDQGYTATLMSQNFIRNLELTDAEGQTTSYAFNSGLKCNTLLSDEYSTHIVSVDKAFIHKRPNINSKTSSYFIAGDEIEGLSIKDNWVETSYIKGSKTGWLRLKDLEEDSYSSSLTKELISSKMEDTSEGIQLVEFDQKKYVLNKDGISNISLGQKFEPNAFDDELSYLEGVDNCFFTTSKQYNDYKHTLSFQVVNDFITGINIGGNDISNGNIFKSYTGVKIGDSIETVLKLHDKQPDEILDSPHTDDPIFIYWTDNSKKTGIRYDMSTGKVLSMSLNFEPHIRYFEGCG